METKIEKCKLQNARCKNSREKEVIRMKRLIGLGLAILLVCGLSVVSFAIDVTQDVEITVTPEVSAAFSITPAAIALGTVDVEVSTGNVDGLTIENTGNVTLTFTKTVASITGGWTLGTPAKDTFMLKAAAQSGTVSSWAAAALELSMTPTYTDLTDEGGTGPLSLDPVTDDTEQLWFMLDMPTEFGSGDAQTITVTIKGTSS